MSTRMDRRSFLKAGTAAAAALGVGRATAAAAGNGAEMDKADGIKFKVKLPGRPYAWEVEIQKGRIVSLDRAADNASDLWLTRGLVDIQVNGYQGVELTDPGLSLEGLEACEKALIAQGLVRWCPTVTSQEPKLIKEVLNKIALAIDKGALRRVHYIHTEANWLSAEEGYRGAHLPQFMEDPSVEEFEAWQAAAKGHIGYVSLAPKRKGALDFIRYLSGKGVMVALVHHNADYDTVQAAVGAGARLSTHLFNGSASVMPRHNNVIYHQLSEDRLWASFIPDGHHIPYHVLRVGLRAKGLERAVFTSDLVSLGGMPEGVYHFPEQEVEVRDGGAFLKGTPYLYGAWSSLAQCVGRVTASGIILPGDALTLASTNPARLLKMADNLEPAMGAAAPFVLFREENGALRLERILS